MARELTVWTITLAIVLGVVVAAWLAQAEALYQQRHRRNQRINNEIARNSR